MNKFFSILNLKSKEFIIFIAAINISKCVILYILLELFLTPHRMIGFIGDSGIFDILARNIISGHGFSLDYCVPFNPTMFKEPVYALFIGLAYLIFGQSFIPLILIQVVLNSFIPIFVYLIGKNIFGDKAARIASFLAALTPIFGEISFFIEAEGFYIPLLLFTVYIMITAFKKDRLFYYALSGLLFGLCSLCRNIVFYFNIFIIILIFLGYGRELKFYAKGSFARRLYKIIIFSVSLFLVVSPWIIRNFDKFKTYQISVRGGKMVWAQAHVAETFSYDDLKAFSLYLISGHLAHRFYPDFIGNNFGDFEYKYLKQAPVDKLEKEGFTEGQIDLILAREGLRKISHHPLRFIIFSSISYLQVFKVFVPWSILLISGNNGIEKIIFAMIRFVMGIPAGLLFFIFVFWGLYALRKLFARFLFIVMLAAYYILSMYFMSVSPGGVQRFVLPIIPLLYLFIVPPLIKIASLFLKDRGEYEAFNSDTGIQ